MKMWESGLHVDLQIIYIETQFVLFKATVKRYSDEVEERCFLDYGISQRAVPCWEDRARLDTSKSKIL
jgi:hypothetical protein